MQTPNIGGRGGHKLNTDSEGGGVKNWQNLANFCGRPLWMAPNELIPGMLSVFFLL